jgi:tellurite resistance protein
MSDTKAAPPASPRAEPLREARPELRAEVEKLLLRLGDDAGLPVVVELGVLIAAADGVIDDAELEALAVLVEGSLGGHVDTKLVRHFVREARNVIQAEGTAEAAARIGGVLRERDVGPEGLAVAEAIALASQGISDVERAALDALVSAQRG